MEHRICTGLGGVLGPGHADMYGAQDMYWFGWSFGTRTCCMCAAQDMYWFGWSFGTRTCRHVWSTGYVLVWVEFWDQDMQACMEHRICTGLGGVLQPGHVACMEHRICTGLGGVLGPGHAACVEHRICTGLGGVLGPGHAGMYGAQDMYWFGWSFATRTCCM